MTFAPTSYVADGVRITLDMNHSPAWEEIDAVQLKGVLPATAAEITVVGNGVTIINGDTTPSTADWTDFGSVAQGGTGLSRVFTVRNDGMATLTLGAVTVPAGYTVTEALVASLAPGASDTFTVRLDAAVVGTKAGDISFTTNDADENPFHFRITGVVEEAGLVQQWASSVLGRSSECSSSPGPWSSSKALGAPDVLVYQDDPNSWAPSVGNGTVEWIALGYTTPVVAQGVRIRESFGNGGVTKIELRDHATGTWQTVWSGVDPTAAGSLADFEVTFSSTSYVADGVRITLDMNHSPAWEEIDAVQLKGVLPATVEQWASSVLGRSSECSSSPGPWSSSDNGDSHLFWHADSRYLEHFADRIGLARGRVGVTLDLWRPDGWRGAKSGGIMGTVTYFRRAGAGFSLSIAG